MTQEQRKVTHDTFTIERVLPHAPAKVWGAFANKDAKAKWFGGEDEGWKTESWELDFRAGGKETNVSLAPDSGARITFEARYYDVIPAERLVFAYEMHIGDQRISVSLTTIELRPEGKGTRLVHTEQGAFLDGFDNPKLREDGTNQLIEKLGKTLEQP